ncbi:hypothetical protein ES703_94328 [subsurface metagenome]
MISVDGAVYRKVSGVTIMMLPFILIHQTLKGLSSRGINFITPGQILIAGRNQLGLCQETRIIPWDLKPLCSHPETKERATMSYATTKSIRMMITISKIAWETRITIVTMVFLFAIPISTAIMSNDAGTMVYRVKVQTVM